MSVSTSVADLVSRLPVGSSAQMMAGWLASARAMVTRWRSPPESSAGRCSDRSASPTWVRPRRARCRASRGRAAEQEGQFDVLHRSDDGEQVEGLEHEAHASGPVAGARPVAHRPQRGPFDFYLALIEAVQAGKAVDQCRLAAPRWPHHGHHLAGGDGQIHAAQGMHLDLAVAEGFVYVSSQDDWLFHGTTPLHPIYFLYAGLARIAAQQPQSPARRDQMIWLKAKKPRSAGRSTLGSARGCPPRPTHRPRMFRPGQPAGPQRGHADQQRPQAARISPLPLPSPFATVSIACQVNAAWAGSVA